MKKLRYKWINYLLMICILLPIIVLVIWSFTARWPWPQLFPTEFTWRGLEELWRQNRSFTQLIFSSIILSLIVATLSVAISLMTARVYVTSEEKVKPILYILIGLPFVVPATVFGMGIHQQMIRWGLNNTVVGVIVVHLVYSLPYATFIINNAYEAIGMELEEEARMLGATKWTAFSKISLPLLFPVMTTAFAMSYLVSFSQYFLTLLIGGGQVQTFTIVMFPYLQSNDRTIASSYSLLFLVITLAIFGFFEIINHIYKRRYQQTTYY